ncbi:hydroxyacylglutathione hydrolase [Pseudenhygromyxa sp. WMMC2535]|uniref:hydroxyacylglutathione hydrolase n=1 Tax=Pseudenhygromyxa sp. WMMC2535 TaxID=2712867 RepID=UPI001552AC28|nr:hydroxyacylglutathione hydrolase [Pseudenhygromyxa sp. WMMC2535]NVB38229.1 hydroxyacylglutathione hydrolase [Pseudenhygromyxa sp. WMMC2535]NVB43584.1 hydroxyacylglutathione hydrolase [Pseudenhygromyxa sp. WMMC2535]
MQHVVSVPRSPIEVHVGARSLELHQIPVWRDNFTWLIVDPRTGEAAAVDGPEADPVLAYLDAHDLELSTIFTTHTHPDHIGLHRDLDKAERLMGLRVIGNAAVGQRGIPGLNAAVRGGDSIDFAGVRFEVMLTEGHIDGHLSYRAGPLLFCGDTLFAGGCGYLFDGPPAKMHASLTRLAALPEDTLVCCAHEYTEDNLRFAWSVEPDNAALAARIREVWELRARGESTVPSTIAVERATNPFLRADSPTIRATLAAALPEAPLETPAQIFAATRALKDRKTYKDSPDSALPL